MFKIGNEVLKNKRPMGHIAYLMKTVQINKHIWLLGEKNHCLLRIEWFLIWTNLNPLHPRVLCAKIGLNWPRSSGEENFEISSMYFRYLVIKSPWKWVWPFIWINLNPLHPGVLCANFVWNWTIGSGEEDF